MQSTCLSGRMDTRVFWSETPNVGWQHSFFYRDTIVYHLNAFPWISGSWCYCYSVGLSEYSRNQNRESHLSRMCQYSYVGCRKKPHWVSSHHLSSLRSSQAQIHTDSAFHVWPLLRTRRKSLFWVEPHGAPVAWQSCVFSWKAVWLRALGRKTVNNSTSKYR